MISHPEALAIVLDTNFKTAVESVSVYDSAGRVLAEDLFATFDMPPFNKSMVDGYACKRKDLGSELTLAGIMAAGEKNIPVLEEGKCYKIMTGAPVPSGTEVVVMVEETEEFGEKVIIKTTVSSANIAVKAEDFKKGDKILSRGTLLKPFHSGIIATLGHDVINVFSKVKVGIIVTGDEIIEPGNAIEPGQIYNANAAQIINYCYALNAIPSYYGIIADSLSETEKAVQEALDKNDVLIITGGVSMGDYDYVAPAIKRSGLKVMFESIASQPGRPLVYATSGNKFCFGMPGNPVSGLVLIETIVKPFMLKIMGNEQHNNASTFKLAADMKRKKALRKSFYPVRLLSDNTVQPIEYHGSAHINSYAEAFGIIALEIGEFEKKQGELVYVRPI